MDKGNLKRSIASIWDRCFDFEGKYDAETSYEELQKRIMAARTRKRLVLWSGSVAAAAVVACVCFVWFVDNKNIDQNNITAYMQSDDITVTVGDKQFVISDETRLNSENNNLIISNGNNSDSISLRNIITISVPSMKQYQFKMSDGSKIWLNSNTILTYDNSQYNTLMREVSLTGEAYFQVNKSSKKFIVHLADSTSVNVYGTEFNISAYKNSKDQKTTLINGRIAFKTANKEHFIEPRQQCVFNTTDGKLDIIDNVNIGNVICWRDGLLSVDNETLQELSHKIETWYGVTVEIQNDSIRNLKFNGLVPNTLDIEQLLSLLRDTGGIDYTIKDNSIKLFVVKH